MTTEEGSFNTRDGTSLYTKTWKPATPSSNHLIFIHGFSDHINAYYTLFPTLSSSPFNITVHGFDQRGWGRSAPQKSQWGATGDTPLVMSDIHDFILHVSNEITSDSSSPTSKLFLMGHSMGGAEALTYALSSTPPSIPITISGLLLESPHITFPPSSQPSSLLVFSGRIAAKVLPNMHMFQPLDASYMCRDPKVCQDWKDDPLCHDTGTLRGLAGLLDRAIALDDLGRGKDESSHGLRGRLDVPVWWAHGTGDKICEFEGSRRLFEKTAAGRDDGSVFRAFEGGYHKLHAEPGGMGGEFAREAGEWIGRIGGGEVGDVQDGKGGTEVAGVVGGPGSEDVKSRL